MSELDQLKVEVAGLRRQVRIITKVLLSNTDAIGSSLDVHLALLEVLDNKAILATDTDIQPELIGAMENQHKQVGKASATLIQLTNLMDDGRDE